MTLLLLGRLKRVLRQRAFSRFQLPEQTESPSPNGILKAGTRIQLFHFSQTYQQAYAVGIHNLERQKL